MHSRDHATPASRRAGGLSILAALALLLGTGLADGVAFAQTHTLGTFPTDEAYIRYLGNRPGSFQADWTTDLNGVTHDDSHWYFAGVTKIFRIPVDQRIDRDMDIPGVPRVDITRVPELNGYFHLGDVSYHRHGGRGFVLAPLDKGPAGAPSLLAIFRGDDTLQLVAVMGFPGQVDGGGRGAAAFVEVDEQGRIYSVGGGLCTSCPGGVPCSCLRRYRLDAGWEAVGSLPVDAISLVFDGEVPLKDAQGGPILLKNFQGAAFAPSRRILYVSNGYDCDTVNPGLHAFDLQTGRELARSGKLASSLFWFAFDCTLMNQEPEGMTVWDLDDVPNPHGIEGQLHVLLLDNDVDTYLGGQDHAYFKHYTGRLYVDDARSSGDGRRSSPYGRLGEALVERDCTWNAYAIPRPPPPPCVDRPAAWSGSTLVLAPGAYPDDLTDPRLEGHAITVRASGTADFGP